MQIDVLNVKGEKVDKIELNQDIFGVEFHQQSVKDAVVLANANIRQASAKTKTRGEVRGGGKKPHPQKGRGLARQGSRRSPLWVGGGVSHGPTGNENYKLKQNRKEARLALKSVLSQKVTENKLTILDQLVVESGKTKDMMNVLSNLKLEGKSLFVDTTETCSLETHLSLNNIPSVGLLFVDKVRLSEEKEIIDMGINVYDVLNAKNLIITKSALKNIEEVLA